MTDGIRERYFDVWVMGCSWACRGPRHRKPLTGQLGFDSFVVDGLAGQGVDLYLGHGHGHVLGVAVQAQHQRALVRVLHHLWRGGRGGRLTAEGRRAVRLHEPKRACEPAGTAPGQHPSFLTASPVRGSPSPPAVKLSLSNCPPSSTSHWSGRVLQDENQGLRLKVTDNPAKKTTV